MKPPSNQRRLEPVADPRTPPWKVANGTRIGHVHLKVADIDRSLAFYRDILGFTETQRLDRRAAFLSADGYHHDLAINTVHSLDGSPAPEGSTGLFHTAIVLPSRMDFARTVKRAVDAGIKLTGHSDHGVSQSVYLDDPDGNGVELYWDRPRSEWPRNADGSLAMYDRPFDLDALVASVSI